MRRAGLLVAVMLGLLPGQARAESRPQLVSPDAGRIRGTLGRVARLLGRVAGLVSHA